jgi:4-amino-4-deoxy-L-arabinose transferase-like glycosyltransferase
MLLYYNIVMLKRNYLLYLILLLAAFLLFYRLSEFMPFIGDQGWFYISARDMLLTGKIPLVGITSSHVWLHQGPYWTYMLAGALWISHFNPIFGAYLTSALGLVAVWLVYKIGSEVFSSRIGLIAALFYATSPMILLNARIPYHTSVIPILTLLLFYIVYKWINGLKYGLPLIILLYTALYNFETATFMLVPIFILILFYGLYNKSKWSKDIFKPKLILLSVLAWIIIMIPMILYDVHHGYPQTAKFIVWLVYKIATVFGFPKLHPDAPTETLRSMSQFASIEIEQMIFLRSALVSWLVLLASFVSLLFVCKTYIKKRDFLQPYSLLSLFFIIPTIGYIVEKTNSGAYLNIFFPTVALMFAIMMDRLMNVRNWFIPGLCLLLLFVLSNIVSLFQTNFLTVPSGYGFSFTQREAVAKQIIQESGGKEYNLEAKGNGSQFISFTMNYEYLAWWMGHGPTKTKEPLRFIIQETPTQILLTKEVSNKKKK